MQIPKIVVSMMCSSFLLLAGCDDAEGESTQAKVTPETIRQSLSETSETKKTTEKVKTDSASASIDAPSEKHIIDKLNATSLKAFETCTVTDDLLKNREYLIKNGKPIQSFEGYLTYKITADFSGLPIKEVIFGVCLAEDPLFKDCSNIEDIALILDVSFEKAKEILKKDKGVDFTVAKRNDTEGATVRPILYKGVDGSTVLHCDTGGL